MNARNLSTVLMLAALPMSAELDVHHFEGPKYLDKSTCHIFSKGIGREACFAPEGDPPGGGGGDPAKFTPEQQVLVDRIVGDRVKKLNSELEVLRATVKEFEPLKQKLAEADQREAAAREEAELKGKSELEKLQHQLQKATDTAKTRDADFARQLAEAQGATRAAVDGRLDYVRRHTVSTALLAAGVVSEFADDAAHIFLRDAQIEMGEADAIKSIAVGGKSFDKPADAAKHFLSIKANFKSPAPGGAGTPRPGQNGNGAPGVDQHHSVESLISAGLAQRASAS